METGTHDSLRVSALAERLDFMTVDDLRVLAGITESTAEAWRKRGKGPAYVRLGNRVFYPRTAVAEFLAGRVTERRKVDPKGQL